jgi:hypothetical protein
MLKIKTLGGDMGGPLGAGAAGDAAMSGALGKANAAVAGARGKGIGGIASAFKGIVGGKSGGLQKKPQATPDLNAGAVTRGSLGAGGAAAAQLQKKPRFKASLSLHGRR